MMRRIAWHSAQWETLQIKESIDHVSNIYWTLKSEFALHVPTRYTSTSMGAQTWTWSIIMHITLPCIIKKSRNVSGLSVTKVIHPVSKVVLISTVLRPCHYVMMHVCTRGNCAQAWLWLEQCERRAAGGWEEGTIMPQRSTKQLGYVCHFLPKKAWESQRYWYFIWIQFKLRHLNPAKWL